MQRQDAWMEKTIVENHGKLYIIGKHILNTYQEDSGLLADDIQEVYLILWKKKEELASHPNITGWLVDTLKNVIANRMRSVFKEKQFLSFSLDDEIQTTKRKGFEAAAECLLRRNEEESANKLNTVYDKLGTENADLLIDYYCGDMTPSELATKMQISEGALRVRIARLKKKIK